MFSQNEIFCGPDCETQTVNGRFRTIKTPTGGFDVHNMVQQLPEDQRPEIIIVKADATGRSFPGNLGPIRCPKVLILGDTHHLKSPIRRLIRYTRQENFDVVMSDHDRQHLHFFVEAGCVNSIWSPCLNIYPHEQRCPDEKIYDVSFVGQTGKWHPYRRYILNYLKMRGVPLNIFQSPHEKAAEIYAESLINLNVSLNGDLNLRVWEVLSSGGFLLTDRLSPEAGLDLLFKDGEHLVCFRNEKDLVDKINYFLKHPHEANDIATNGYEAYKKSHTPEKKVEEVMSYIFDGELNPLYDSKSDRGAVYAESEGSQDLMERVALYEFFQECHLNNASVSVVIWPGVDPRIVCDLMDLPRLNITVKNEGGDAHEDALGLFRKIGGTDRITFSSYKEICEQGLVWDALIITDSDLLENGIEGILRRLRFKWLVMTGWSNDGSNKGREAIEDRLATAGFERDREYSNCYLRKDRAILGGACISTRSTGMLEKECITSTGSRMISGNIGEESKKNGGDAMKYQETLGNQERGEGANSPEAAYGEVQQLMETGGEKEAIGGLRMFLSIYPDYARAHNDLGVLYFNQGEKEKALLHHERAARLEPENATFQKNLADFYFVEAGRLEDALKIYLKVLETNPTDIETLLTLGIICVSLEKKDDAKVFFNRVLELEPWNMDARERLDAIEQGADPDVGHQRSEIREQGSELVEQRVQDGWTNDWVGEPRTEDQAWKKEADLQGSGSADFKMAEKMHQEVQGLLRNDQQAEAIRQLERVVEIYPDYALAHNDLGVLYFKEGEKEKAVFHYERAADLDPENITFQKNLADFYCIEAERLEDALRIYLRVLEANPTDIETLLTLGIICVSLGKRDDAKVFYNRVLELEPWNMDAREKLDALSSDNLNG
ncbi:MAG: tetratricopeptide repeat protein [Deltaproteobacteria bacterium]|nr:tetratricopeptide repeat protein [Deltaproteobacteria bacterium]